MKVIFCDVDGVLNNPKTRGHTPTGFMGVSNDLIRNLKKLVEYSGARIVLSSDWRLTRDDPEHRKDYRYLTRKLKSIAGLEIFDHTDDISWNQRGQEIRKYLNDHPDINGYVVLDDEPFRTFQIFGVASNLVLTVPDMGLTDADIERAAMILSGQQVEAYDSGLF